LDYALWVDRINIKSAIKTSPYTLVYGKRPILPMYIELMALKILQEMEDHNFKPLQSRFNQLLKLEEDHSVSTLFTTYGLHLGLIIHTL